MPSDRQCPALPTLIEEFAPSRVWINPRLRDLLRQDLPPEQARRVRLALLPFDPVRPRRSAEISSTARSTSSL